MYEFKYLEKNTYMLTELQGTVYEGPAALLLEGFLVIASAMDRRWGVAAIEEHVAMGEFHLHFALSVLYRELCRSRGEAPNSDT